MSALENAEPVNFLIKAAIERDPKKRRVKPIESQASLLDFDLGESSDDSDFRIEDHAEPSDDDESLDSRDADLADSSDEKDSEEDSEDSDAESVNDLKLDVSHGVTGGDSHRLSVAELIEHANNRNTNNLQYDEKAAKILICCGCLGDRSDDANEIVECDGCGVTVHEGCYGVSDSTSISSTVSSCSTEPWFCEACRAGVVNPVCELCPNSGGIYKETDVGKWVHLVCALYVPGVAFGEVDQLTSVTLFEMPYSRWGARTCCLCSEERFARTGVCIGCDAGMCRTYFHVTCAQREGFLSEAHSEEVDQADPFYAHCKLHSDKTLVRRRKRNWLALQLRTQHRKIKYEQEGHSDTPNQLRIQRKLGKYRQKYLIQKSTKIPPWVPTQKMPRLLTTSASACRRLLKKAELMGIDTVALEMQESQIAALVDVRKKWHIPPAFSVEFIGYYLDRNSRLLTMKQGLEELLETNAKLLDEQQELRTKYDQMMKASSDQTRINISLKQTVHKYHSAILSACPNKSLPAIDELGRPPVARHQLHQPTTMAVPTAAALKMGVGFPLNNRSLDTGRVLSSQASRQDNLLLNNECGICHKRNDQHLLAKCDTCHLYYHLYCLNPPLTRLPKKSKLYGWQCSECDKTSDSEQDVIIETKTPRRSRTRNSNSKDDTSNYMMISTSSDSTPQQHRHRRRSSHDNSFTTPIVKIKPLEQPPVVSSAAITNATSTFTTNQMKHSYITNPLPPPPPTTTNIVTTVGGHHHHHHHHHHNNHSGGITTVVSPPPVSTSPQLMDCQQTSSTLYLDNTQISSKSAKKRRRDKHRSRYSPDMLNPSREHKRKRKKKSLDIENPNIVHPRITIKIKSIPLQPGEKSQSKPQMFYVPNEYNEMPSNIQQTMSAAAAATHTLSRSPKEQHHHQMIINNSLTTSTPVQSVRSSRHSNIQSHFTSLSDVRNRSNNRLSTSNASNLSTSACMCCVCNNDGSPQDTVQCDDCKKSYHFTCLEPPVKKTPKRRGYSWHCADCDPTASDTN